MLVRGLYVLNLVAGRKQTCQKLRLIPYFWRKLELLTCIMMKTSGEIQFKSPHELKP